MKYKNVAELKKVLKEKCKQNNLIYEENDITSCSQTKTIKCRCSICGNIKSLRINEKIKNNRKCAKCKGTKNKTNEEKIAYLKKKAKKCNYTILNDILFTNRNDTKIQLRCNK